MRRVIFVDDEPAVLSALRRVLRRTAGDWTVSFVGSGAEAFAAIEREPFDVVVSDCMMPGMDGGELVERVRRLRPGMVRILLTGNAPVETMMRAESVAHRLLAKPCPPERIHAAVESAVTSLEQLPDEGLRALVAGTPMLPTCEDVASRLAAAGAGDGPADLEAVAATAAEDPAVEARLLKLVHAGFFGGVEEPLAGAEAARRLGPDTIAILLRRGRAADAAIPTPIDPGAERVHGRRVAAEAMRLAEHRGLAPPRVAVAGVAARLLGVGRLVASAGLRDAWLARAEELAAPGLGSADAERTVLGVPACRVGASLLGLWGLPAPVTAAVRGAAAPEPGTIAEIVALADQSVREGGGDAVSSRAA